FDTVLSAVALTDNFIVMAAAIIISGALMVLMAESVANFLNRNRMYEVVGLFVLLLVGILLTSEGGHLAHLKFFGFEVEAMSKTTFYFVLVTMVLVEIVQGRYQRKLLAEKSGVSRKTGKAI
ncbi:MAG: tellurium resistance protein TerC, partial [Pseudomonadota bacterium]